jgi:DNA-binding CsgD family transcriptional regulator
MSRYTEAYREILKCAMVDEEVLRKHTEQQTLLDALLPDAASFFYLIEIASQKYHFVGRRQMQITGYSNAELIEQGLGFFFECLHPEDAAIIVNGVYPDFRRACGSIAREDVTRILMQYNFRFKRKDGKYVNLLEQLSIASVDSEGNPSLLLGNIISLNHADTLPVQCAIKLCPADELARTLFSRNYRNNSQPIGPLSTRERQILSLLALGKNSRTIAAELCISRHTVDTHRRALLRKLQCRSVVELSRLAFLHGLI